MLMTAAMIRNYGSPQAIRIASVNRPTPGPTEVLVRVRASGVTAADTMIRAGTPYLGRLALGFPRPKVRTIGTGFAGTIEACGNDVTQFSPGDRVYGGTGMKFSANAEYVSLGENELIAPIPEGLSFAEAAALTDGALTSLSFLERLADLKPGQKVLIIGASGSLGTAGVQIARSMGAVVTGVSSAANADLVRELGAQRVIDYRTEDFTRGTERYDVIYDTLGISSFRRSRRVLTPRGRYLSPVLGLRLLLNMAMTARSRGQRALFSAAGLRPVDEQRAGTQRLNQMVEDGRLRVVLDRTYPLARAAEAHAYVETGHKRGNVALMS